MNPPDLKPFLEEDVGTGDVTCETFLPKNRIADAVITCEQDACISGLEEAAGIFALLGITAESLCKDGDFIAAGTIVMKVHGEMRSLMTAERTALNFLMRMSGISDATYRLVSKMNAVSPETRIAATRKTTPGFRYFEKKAVALGGGWTHRMGLYDMVMVKDNHIAAAGGIKEIAKKMKNVPDRIKTEIEVLNYDEGIEAAEAGADIIMADHFSPAETKRLKEGVKRLNPDILIEASGNITSENVLDYAGCADIVSLGELTHSVKAVHFSMDIV